MTEKQSSPVAPVGVSEPSADGWEPIETAPKDGSWFVARQNGEAYPCQWIEHSEADWETAGEGWFDLFNGSFEEPTQWRGRIEGPPVAAANPPASPVAPGGASEPSVLTPEAYDLNDRDGQLRRWASECPPGYVWVCPDCDRAGCKHTRPQTQVGAGSGEER